MPETEATPGAETAMFRTLDDIGDVHGKRILVREDLNVPMADGEVSHAGRLRAARATVNELAEKGAIVLVLAHFGRPKGKPDPALSLKQVVPAFADVLRRPVAFVEGGFGPAAAAAVAAFAPGTVAVLENSRFYPGEKANAEDFVAEIARLGDIYVNDAFSVAHRAHATTEGLAHVLPAYAGRSMEQELNALDKALGHPAQPVVAVVGGAKVSTKLAVLHNLVRKVDHLIIGGGMANTFLAAQGISVGKSLCEHDLGEKARAIMDEAEAENCTIHLPYEVVVAKELREGVDSEVVNIYAVPDDSMILDCGPQAIEMLADVLKTCATTVWNGPLGAFEVAPFDHGTTVLAEVVAALTADGSMVSVAGGGDTAAALRHAGVARKFTYLSTAGGAFLEWLEGRPLPGVEALMRAA